MLATSRQPLGVGGEKVTSVDALDDEAAVELYIDRAVARHGALFLAGSASTALEALCRRLEGIPLAITVAASSEAGADPAVVLAALDDRPDSTSTDALTATIEWSDSLLHPRERAVWYRSSIFVGGFTLEAAEGVCTADDLDEFDVLDVLAGLVAKSLIHVDSSTGSPRYRSFVVLRAHAQAKLQQTADPTDVRRRHHDWFVGLVRANTDALSGVDEVTALDLLEAEHENLQAVLLRSAPEGWPEGAFHLIAPMSRFWEVRGHWSLGVRMMQVLLDRPTPLRHPRALAASAAGRLAMWLGDYPAATTFYEQAAEEYTALEQSFVGQLDSGPPEGERDELERRLHVASTGVTQTLVLVCDLARHQGDLDRATAAGEEAVRRARALGDEVTVQVALGNLGVIDLGRGDLDAAATTMAQSLEMMRAAGDTAAVAQLVNNLGAVEWMRGDFERARTLYVESLAVRRSIGDQAGIAQSLVNVADVDCILGRDASADCAESLAIARELGHRDGIATALRLQGEIAIAAGNLREAEVTLAEAAAEFESLGDGLGQASAIYTRACAARLAGALDRARALGESVVDYLAAAGDAMGEALCRVELALVDLAEGDRPAAAAQLVAAADAGPGIVVAEAAILSAAAQVLIEVDADASGGARTQRWAGSTPDAVSGRRCRQRSPPCDPCHSPDSGQWAGDMSGFHNEPVGVTGHPRGNSCAHTASSLLPAAWSSDCSAQADFSTPLWLHRAAAAVTAPPAPTPSTSRPPRSMPSSTVPGGASACWSTTRQASTWARVRAVPSRSPRSAASPRSRPPDPSRSVTTPSSRCATWARRPSSPSRTWPA